MRKYLLIGCLFLCSCTTMRYRMTRLDLNMTEKQTLNKLGHPDSKKVIDGYELWGYSNRIITGWAWDRADFYVILKDQKLVAYGMGEARPSLIPLALSNTPSVVP